MASSNLFERSHSLYDQEEDEISDEQTEIEWSNIIFLPFHPVFQLVVQLCVIVKCILGPLRSVYPVVNCYDVMDNNIILLVIKYFYLYGCDPIYALDTVLHIVHRQVADKAMRREHLPKSAFLLLIDIISLIPFFSLITEERCPPTTLFPNILCFSEFIIIYRVSLYFEMTISHSLINLTIGFTVIMILFIHSLTCFWLLLTSFGLCAKCADQLLDWRYYLYHKIYELDTRITTYVYGTAFLMTFIFSEGVDDTKPSTIAEFFVVGFFVTVGFLLLIFVFLPKLFAESILSLRRIFAYQPHVQRLVDETRRRHLNPQAPDDVGDFYNLLWNKRSGITCIPEIISGMPKHLRIDLKEDLVWPIFYHSPILKKTSQEFRRMLCELIISDYKLPGEKFFSGLHSLTNFYYLKSGTVQIISSDDGITPILSLTSGTVFGDVSFIFPPLRRRVLVRCLTYCEVLFLPRLDYLKTIHKYPEDRKIIIQAAKERLHHAQLLFNCKTKIRGVDRSEDENIVWLKKRWWEISNTINAWRKTCTKKEDTIRCQLPSENNVYHCAKYIGQLVLCHETKLQKKSIFASVRFPWILLPSSLFIVVWKRIVLVTVVLVLILYPPLLGRYDEELVKVRWFKLFQYWTDFVYISDICILLLTSLTQKEESTNFVSVMFERCKTFKFCLDILATFWFENLVVFIGLPRFYTITQFNRLIKIHILFKDYSDWDLNKNPLQLIHFRVASIKIIYIYVTGHMMYTLIHFFPKLHFDYWFYLPQCIAPNGTQYKCEPHHYHLFGVFISWVLEYFFEENTPKTVTDIYFSELIAYGTFLITLYNQSIFIAALYLNYREATNFQDFVSNLKKYYVKNDIHEDLLKRLDRYLVCHWKYYKGVDIMHPSLLKNEPYDIYWKVQGEVAEKIVSESQPFVGASSSLIRELAYAAKFLILPKNSTIFLFGVQCRNVTWIVQGYIKCEYHDDNGKLLTVYYSHGYLLSMTSVFFGKTSLRTYTAYTDCEVIHMRIQDFYRILKRYPQDWHHFDTVIQECRPWFDDLYRDYMEKHMDYKKALRKRIFHARASMVQPQVSRDTRPNLLSPKKPKTRKVPISLSCKEEIVDEHKALFLKYWMPFRVIIVIISLLTSTSQGGYGALYRIPLIIIGYICDGIAVLDILLKISLAYYDDNGIVIYSRRKCAIHYLSRGFIMDIIGVIPWYKVLKFLMYRDIDENDGMLINTACKFAHLYLVMGYMDYLGDKPTVGGAITMILKWQVVVLLTMVGASQFLMSYCVFFKFDSSGNLLNITRREECWSPDNMSSNPTADDLHLLYIESMYLAQCSLMKVNFRKFFIDKTKLGLGVTLILLYVMYWYVMCYSVTLLVLSSRGNVLFQHGVSQLESFLKSERVDAKLVKQALAHFTYWWMRTNGINIHHLSNERLGAVFRQDLNYYFYHKTFTALDSLLNGGKSLERQLASSCIPHYVLPSHEIVREMDFTSNVFIVHRGKVIITKDDKHIFTLTRGSMFGQLDGTPKSRPIQISAMAEDYVDLLPINVKTFNELISEKVRNTISIHPTSKFGFMATKKYYAESPYDTVQNLIGIRKTIKLPFMKSKLECRHGNWYYRFLYFVWFFSPVTSTVIITTCITLPYTTIWKLYWFLLCLDFFHLVNWIMEFFTMELKIVNNKCVPVIQGLSVFKKWYIYVDLITLLVPLLTFFISDWRLQVIKLLRLRLFHLFYVNFCLSFKSRLAPMLLKLVIYCLILHSLSCIWIWVSCKDEVFPISVKKTGDIFIDRDEWVEVHERKGGCGRMTIMHNNTTKKYNEDTENIIYIKPKYMENDYVVAATYVLMALTNAFVTTTLGITLKQVYYKVFLNYALYLLNLALLSTGISFVYTRYRELYQHDYNIQSLILFLKQSGISPSLLESLTYYSRQIWKRQKGDWIPELAQTAPMCIRQDLFCALYMHHLRTPVLFRTIPLYFVRQVATRLKRIVVFPGKNIVEEGDISPVIYFIHEGEVEKWCKSRKTGENQLISLLSTNGYFGFVPGLFPNVPFQFTYRARTVVDIVYLRLQCWQDLLDGYQDIKRDLYTEAKQMRKEIGHRFSEVGHGASFVLSRSSQIRSSQIRSSQAQPQP